MNCPYFKHVYIGICVTSDVTRTPSINEMKRYCFSEHFTLCPFFEYHRSSGEVKTPRHTREKIEQFIYSEISKDEGAKRAKMPH